MVKSSVKQLPAVVQGDRLPIPFSNPGLSTRFCPSTGTGVGVGVGTGRGGGVGVSGGDGSCATKQGIAMQPMQSATNDQATFVCMDLLLVRVEEVRPLPNSLA